MRAWLLLLLLMALMWLVWAHGWRPPDRYNPWAKLDLRASPDAFFRYKLQRLAEHPAQCRAALSDAGASFSPLTDRDDANGCGWSDAVRLRGTGVASLRRSTIVTCPLAASLVLLDRQVLQPQAQAIYGQSVRQIDHVGSYACRRVDHRDSGPLSRHARAAAIDVTGFELADGRAISVSKDWTGNGRDAEFLRLIHDGACGVSGMVLGPDYDRAHRSHFHIQQAGWGYCR